MTPKKRRPFDPKPEKSKRTEPKSIRLSPELLEAIEVVLKKRNMTFNSFVVQACEYALDSMDDIVFYETGAEALTANGASIVSDSDDK